MPYPRFTIIVGLLPLAVSCASDDPDTTPGLGTGRFGASGEVRGTLSASPNEPVSRFAIVGDFGANTQGQRAVMALVRSWQPDAVLTVGDNNYLAIDPDTPMEVSAEGRPLTGWQMAVGAHFGEFIARRADGKHPELVSPIPRLFPTVGNHDRGDVPDAQGPLKGYHDYFRLNPGGAPRLPEDREAVHTDTISYYAVRLGPVDCFMLDSNPPAEFNEAAAAVLEAQRQWFAKALRASTARWKIACFHHSPHGSGSYGGHPRMRWPEFAGLDAIFCGHDHLYERLVFNDDGSDSGPILIVAGHGGANLYEFKQTVPQSRVRQAGIFGALWLRAGQDGFAIDAWSVDPESGNRRLIDSVHRGTPPSSDASDDYWFHAPAGMTVEVTATALESPAPDEAALRLELWGPDGLRRATDVSPLTRPLDATGRWRVRVASEMPGEIEYRLSLASTDQLDFATWQKRHFNKSPARESAASSDPDRDGMDNLTEFALGLDPRRRDSTPPRVTTSIPPNDSLGDILEVWVQPPAPLPPGIRLILEENQPPPGSPKPRWNQLLTLDPWQPPGAQEGWETVASDSNGTPTPPRLRWLRGRGPGPPPSFRWRAEPLPPPPPPSQKTEADGGGPIPRKEQR
jgi:hypothetical protein